VAVVGAGVLRSRYLRRLTPVLRLLGSYLATRLIRSTTHTLTPSLRVHTDLPVEQEAAPLLQMVTVATRPPNLQDQKFMLCKMVCYLGVLELIWAVALKTFQSWAYPTLSQRQVRFRELTTTSHDSVGIEPLRTVRHSMGHSK